MTIQTVKDYYGKTLKTSADLQTSACCDASSVPDYLKPLLSKIHPQVLEKYYGCGLVAPSALAQCQVLDLGSGSGRDAYLLAQLVGPQGAVVGVDMTDEQLATAQAHVEWHREVFGFAHANTSFKKGYIEKLDQLNLDQASFDIVISNCVINLSVDKPAVFKGAYDLLKSGGEFYFSDVYCDRRVPAAVAQDPELYGECLGGALYWNDFLAMAKKAGFLDPRLVTSRPLDVTNPRLAAKLGSAKFFSATYRLFKLPQLETACEDYGQAVIYKGTIAGNPDAFTLDDHHDMERGRIFPVCGNTWLMLNETRFKQHFDFVGDFSHHHGIFPGCGTNIPFMAASNEAAAATPGCC